MDRVDSMRRRRFLKLMGASFAAAALPGCDFRRPVERIIPYTAQPEETVPGVASWYATTCLACPASCGVLAKSRDGRPIKLEGNPDHPVSAGGLCPRGQASVLDLYDSERLRAPLLDSKPVDWPAVDSAVLFELARIRKEGGAIRLVTGSLSGPTFEEALTRFLAAYPTARRVVHETGSAPAIREAHRRAYGRALVPWYHFEKARVIVSLDADFMGTWIDPVAFARGWATSRSLEGQPPTMSWHAQFEPRMSMTGGSADLRVAVPPSAISAIAVALGRRVARFAGLEAPKALPPEPALGEEAARAVEECARRLAAERGAALVVSGSADPGVQLTCAWINHALGSDGRTLDLARPAIGWQGDAAGMDTLIDEVERGQVAALLVLEANPVHTHPRGAALARAMAKVRLTASLAGRHDETARAARYVAPDHHPLESWGDREVRPGLVGVVQPLIAPLFGTRAAVETLTAWAGKRENAHALMQRVWRERVLPRQSRARSFTEGWDGAVQAGVTQVDAALEPVPPFDVAALGYVHLGRPAPPATLELALHLSHALYDGRQANNPWLQELPDPISKVTWGNHASIAPATARRLGVVDGRVVRLTAGERAVELPVLIQRGMPSDVVAVALGYGRPHAGKIAGNFPVEKMLPVAQLPVGGADLYPFTTLGYVELQPLDRMETLARTQTFDEQVEPITGRERPIVRERAFSAHAANPESTREKPHPHETLWPEHEYRGPKWEMVIDLSACNGCSACLVGCQVENNVPVVGRSEVARGREMHWLRLDRYYHPARDGESQQVGFQPMLCQHCDNAPCETVCPALATAHSTEGLNVQAYNRCVGTRYCANNCPYKVRRFNWFDYAHSDLVQNLVLNPDITVRTRGIMEKCSFCTQRIAEARRDAHQEDRPIADGTVKPACAQSCPTQAIIFGDANDPGSRVSRAKKDPRGYRVIAELGTRPAVTYLTRIRNDGKKVS